MPVFQDGDFPFKEIRDHNGDFFNTRAQAMQETGYSEDHIWSILQEDDENNWYFTYGPSRHYVNLLGYIATKEKHDGNTYYTEVEKKEP